MLPIPRDLERQLRKMGLKVEELRGVKLVLIETEDKEIMIEEPQVLVMTLKDQKIFQVIGTKVKEVREAETKKEETVISISEDDIKFVAEQAGITYEKAKEILEKAGGDIAKALMLAQEGSTRKT
ncbi:MAG: nascent polypeptide-associated complex protein [Desulfurococcales archaeon]|jgi:nascent polypeptide-associated complex subunit alpha|nr:nascent polypeptide-associated complex protein [Desulfurococcales archaeon]